jgi:hypothetical protein
VNHSISRVVVDEHGTAVPYVRARDHHQIQPAIVFIREDGWTLGAPKQFETVAYSLWMREWVWFYNVGDQHMTSITEYTPKEQ